MNKLFETIIIDTDSYKYSHYKQYPEGTEKIWSYIEPRTSDVEIVNFGLQAFIKEYLTTPITMEDVEYGEKFVTAHGLPFNKKGWKHIVDKHDGYLPLLIEALPEGTVFNSGNCQLQITNSDPECFWLVSYVETALLRAIWYPSTIATNSRNIKKSLKHYWEMSSDAPIESLNFKLHDFGSRGVSSRETAKLGGMAHLVNFLGTDTGIALFGAMEYYSNPNKPEINMPGFSIPASEHSTITSWGKDHELEAYRNMIEVYGGDGKIYACVSDSYDFSNAVDNIWGQKLKSEILEKGGTLVVRPDSGDPLGVIMYALQSLWNNFGGSVNSKGYKVLHPSVRLIQGDGIDANDIERILNRMMMNQWSIDNIAFGMGGGLLQKVNRDTYSYAQKACAIKINGVIQDVYKKPATDTKKNSKRGILSTYVEGGVWKTTNDRSKNQMIPIFENGKLKNETTWAEIKERAKI